MGETRMDESSGLVVELPWPPSVNHYWGRCGTRYFIGAKGIAFREIVSIKTFNETFGKTSRLSVKINAHPPDKRRRDLDNILKCLLDSFQHAGVYEDDNQIDDIHIIRMPSLEGKVIVHIQSISN
jgi:crossover junction endodeoxyribonuclease RusA